MTARPAKRQRRTVIYSSESEAEGQVQNGQRLSKQTVSVETDRGNTAEGLSTPSQLQSNSFSASDPTDIDFGASFTPSLPDQMKETKFQPSNQLPHSSLHRFFGPASSEQRWSSQKFETTKGLTSAVKDGDDIIDDDYDSFDELFTQHLAEESVTPDPNLRPNYHNQTQQSFKEHKSGLHRFANAPKRFIIPPEPESRGHGPRFIAQEDDNDPWTKRYRPRDLNELAVHKKKVSDVQNWLDRSFVENFNRKLLVLRGPAGSGKTVTLSLLSDALGFDILEWKNPPVSQLSEKGFVSISTQFDEFLARGHEFGGLDMDGTADAHAVADHDTFTTPHRRVILIEEFPAILNRNSSNLAAFRLSLQRYLAMSMPPASNDLGWNKTHQGAFAPIVLILSETLLNSGSSSSEILTVHRLLGPEIYNHPSTTIIDFNSIAPTFMHKAIKLVLDKEHRRSERQIAPSPAVLNAISKTGDIRCAISSLEFLCRGGEDLGGRMEIANRTQKPTHKDAALTFMEKEILDLVTQRESSLGIFHAVGKIMYNKRDIVSKGHSLPSPPDHISHHGRSRMSQVSVNELADETGTDIQTFISALHENYVPSCDGTSFLDSLDGCIEALSDSDMLSIDRKYSRGNWTSTRVNASRISTGVDTMRQQDISYQVATRGLLFALPYPVKRRIGHAGRTCDAHRMFFPTSLQLSHDAEEIEGLISLWMTKLLDPFMPNPLWDSGNTPSSGKSGKVASSGFNDAHPLIVTMISHEDLLLYQLPYMTRMSQGRAELGALKKITSFSGVGIQSETLEINSDHTDDSNVGYPSADHQNPLQVLRLKNAKSQMNNHTFGPRLPLAHEDQDGLVLSDDDIVDD